MFKIRRKEKEKIEQVAVELKNVNYDVNYFLNMAEKMQYKGPNSGDDIQYHKGSRKGYRRD
ncbi:hypothetical protein P4679_23225 [Priestia megaterium]|jgi:hypothetical protein|uniref:hypothetical protein n=1 Tax=Priestia megaterium TaxID=1404 RepID=UPI002E1AA9CF|nr:hypothetical protein [Priestia megaterium]